jgi:hypothetical protein
MLMHVKLIQCEIENLSLKTLHIEEVRSFFFLKENVGNVSSALNLGYYSVSNVHSHLFYLFAQFM